MRKLVFFFDGTWNGRDDEHPTNVRKMAEALVKDIQVGFYFPGPGNEDENSLFGEVVGGVFGYGSKDIRDQGVETLNSVYDPATDEVYVIGFSRGAAIARMFASKAKVPIKLLVCFDTVGAYLPFGRSQQGLFHDLHVSPYVEKAFHAVAIHENRAAFVPNLMNKRTGIEEIWFKGSHCDVGGGNGNTKLSDIPLAEALLRLGAHDVVFDMEVHPDEDAPVCLATGFYRREDRLIHVKQNDKVSTLIPIIHEKPPPAYS